MRQHVRVLRHPFRPPSGTFPVLESFITRLLLQFASFFFTWRLRGRRYGPKQRHLAVDGVLAKSQRTRDLASCGAAAPATRGGGGCRLPELHCPRPGAAAPHAASLRPHASGLAFRATSLHPHASGLAFRVASPFGPHDAKLPKTCPLRPSRLCEAGRNKANSNDERPRLLRPFRMATTWRILHPVRNKGGGAPSRRRLERKAK